MARRLRTGFTLVELMIVVAIIGILAAIAIPNFQAMTYRARRAEVPVNVAGIRDAVVGYEAVADEYPTTKWEPDTSTAKLDKKQKPWFKGGKKAKKGSGFAELGWSPDGDVRGQYRVTNSSGDFLVEGRSDVDDDDIIARYTATRTVGVVFLDGSDTY